MSYLVPDGPKAVWLKSRLSDSWRAGVVSLMPRQVGSESAKFQRFLAQHVPDALDFAAYFDLQLALHGGIEPARAVELEASARRSIILKAHAAGLADRTLVRSHSLPFLYCYSTKYFSLEELERLKRWFDVEGSDLIKFDPPDAHSFERAVCAISLAWELVSWVDEQLEAELKQAAGQIILLQGFGSEGRSFRGASSLALWGAIALNVLTHSSVLEYYTSLVHESSHSLLFAHAMDTPLVLNDPQLTYQSPLRDEPRPMDGVFHAAFVSAREIWALRRLLPLIQGREYLLDSSVNEMGVRHAISKSEDAFNACHEVIMQSAQLTPLGAAVIGECRAFV